MNLEVPRTNPVPESEIAIGARLREWRKDMRLEQIAVAQSLEIDSRRLGAYESGRIPLPCHIGLRLYEKLEVSPAYLVEGRLPHKLPYSPEIVSKASAHPRMLFSEAYGKFLKGALPKRYDARAFLQGEVLSRLQDPEIYLPCFDNSDDNYGVVAMRIFKRFVEDRVVFADQSTQAMFLQELIELLLSRWKLPVSGLSAFATKPKPAKKSK